MWTYACGTASARVICAAMPLRIWVIGRRTSSAPSGNSIGAPAGAAGAGARGAARGGCGGRGRSRCRRGAGAVRRPGAGAAPPVRIVSTTFRTSSRVIRPPPPVPDDLGRGQVVLAQQPTDGGGHPGVRVGDGRRRGRSRGSRGGGHLGRAALVAAGGPGGDGRGRGGCLGGGLGRRRRGLAQPPRARRGREVAAGPVARGARSRRPAPSSAVSMTAISALFGTVAPFLDEDLAQDALERRRDLGVDLVGDDLDERLVLGDVVARLLEPLPDRPLGDALAELGHRHLGHVRRSSEVRAASRGRAGSLRVVSPIRASGRARRGATAGIRAGASPTWHHARHAPAPVDGDR